MHDSDQAVLAAVRQANERLRPWVEGRVKRLGAWTMPAAVLLLVVPAPWLGWLWLPFGLVLAATTLWSISRIETTRTGRQLRAEVVAAARRADPGCDEARLREILRARPWGIRIFPTNPGVAQRILVAIGLPAGEMAEKLRATDGVGDPEAVGAAAAESSESMDGNAPLGAPTPENESTGDDRPATTGAEPAPAPGRAGSRSRRSKRVARASRRQR